MFFRIVDNSDNQRKIWFDKKHSANSQESWTFGLEEDVYEELTPCEEMDLSELEQENFENCKNCYV